MKEIKKYLKQLLPTGILYFVGGLFCVYIFYNGIQNDSYYNIAFALIGIIFGYIAITYIDSGGHTSFTLLSSSTKVNPNEEKFDELIKSYKNKILVLLSSLIVLLIVGKQYFLNYSKPFVFNINIILWTLFWSWISTIILGTGVKYISAGGILKIVKNIKLSVRKKFQDRQGSPATILASD